MLTRCNRGIVVVSMQVWVDHMVIKNAAISTFNMLTFKDEAHLTVWINFWEKYGEAFFLDLSKHGCLRITFNLVWNKEGQFKASSYIEYESPEAFKACQKLIANWSEKPEWQEFNKAEGIMEATRNIILQDHSAE